MFNLRIVFIVLLFLSTNSFADKYIHLGGGLDIVKHGKSSKNYLMLNLKGGVGYKFTEKYAVELDITGSSGSKYDNDGICTTTIGTRVSCTKSEEITRQMIVGSVIYTKEVKGSDIFFKAGFGLVRSSFRSAYDSTAAASLVIADEKDKAIAGVVSAGIIKSQRHRMGVILSTEYGSSNIGDFSFFGFEYNYLMPL